MILWSHDPFSPIQGTTGTDPVQSLINWSQTVNGGLFTHHLSWVPQQTPSEAALRALYPRIVSHVMINVLPDQALPELVDTLKAMIEFYNLPAHHAPAPPRLEERRAIAGEVYTRPEFYVAED
jgi:hypothetical protein